MADDERLRLMFTDPHRVWQDLIGPAERSDGRVFVPHDAVLDPGAQVRLLVVIEGGAEVVIPAVVELSRRPSLRFSRGVFLKLEPGALHAIREIAGDEKVGSPSLGRAERRYAVPWKVTFRTPALMKPLLTQDVSVEGMHVQMPERVKRGHILEFTLHIPPGHEIDLRGEVQWTSELSDRVGVRYLLEDEQAALLLRHVIQEATRTYRSTPSGSILVVGGEGAPERLEEVLHAEWPDAVARLAAPQALAEIRRSRPGVVLLPKGPLAGPIATSLKLDAELRIIRVVVYGDEPGLAREAKELGAAGSVPWPADPAITVQRVRSYLQPPERLVAS